MIRVSLKTETYSWVSNNFIYDYYYSLPASAPVVQPVVAPSQPGLQAHKFGAVHIPPFEQAGEH